MRFANAFAKSHGVELENDYKGDKRITYLNHAHDERASDFDKLLSKATGESDKVRGKDYDGGRTCGRRIVVASGREGAGVDPRIGW